MGRLENAMRRASGEEAGTAAIELPLEHAEEQLPSEATVPPVQTTPSALAVADVLPAQRPADPVAETLLRRQVNAALATKTVIDDAMMPASREQYRRLAAALHQAQRASGFKVVMVASAVAGEGKTLTASNVAMTLSESYRRDVLLIDADLRRPSLHSVFQVPGTPGLSEGLLTPEDPNLPLHRVSDRLTVLPAGRPTSDPIGALTSERMRRLIDEAREVFDWVIIDTPPVGLLTDAALLSAMADGVLLVVKAESTPFDMVQRAAQAIGRDRVIGAVLNRVDLERNPYYYAHYYRKEYAKYYAKAPGRT